MVLATDATGGGGSTSSKSRNGLSNTTKQVELPYSLLVRLLFAAFAFTFGTLNWLFFLFLALKSGKYFTKPDEKAKNEFALGQDALWNLSKKPIPGFDHAFHGCRDGFQLHYICNQSEAVANQDLFILIHGFPNTCMTWRYLLKQPEIPLADATFVAVDMPGYGGSDSLSKYDTQVLEYLTEFIVAMREKYGTVGDSVGSTFVVGHDWGCVVSMRLAAEAPSLADRFILSNGPLPELVKSNIIRAVTSSRRIFKQFQMSPRENFGCLAKSYQAIKPLLKQAGFSGYIFAFRLPSMFVRYLGAGGNLSFLQASHRAEHSSSRDEYKVHESKAANFGPSIEECKSRSPSGAKYGPSVAERVESVANIFWHTTAYYRDGLAVDPWEKSIETVAALYNLDSDMSSSESPSRRRSSSAASALFNDNIVGGLRAPTTILWGENDLALLKPICLDGIGDYLPRESEVILFPKGSHWIQVDRETRKTFAQIIAMFACGNSRQTPSYIAKEVQALNSGATLMVRR